ncbi:P-loop containing nucleoside triphosphate hydrolase protein [Xylaria bambusicola]|uniref:P-loop containing nucleoside triphosphate hydrolase protein n=1 Tax=Xylaria bambusicola TaxID=326684 RepID=UPI0020089EFA|nr:P-loop containing nucleoside triphosphate hydrolase protein [Xylaria bambusicola]KAI0520919.1 P-loop containing nucleoside triphosphate hydrolase protein [Xylaria bambusicola]
MFKMPRAASPALSENEVDILGSLLTNGDESSQAKTKHAELQDGFSFDVEDLLDGDDGDKGDDDEAFIALKQAAAFRKNSNLKGTTLKKGGGFQSMGLNGNLLKAITRVGFRVPTPIQRKTIPLILQRKDLLAMARTGSGKTAAFLIPMVQTLKAHSPNMGARALILSPSRELAIQTLSVTKSFTRGTDLKTMLCVGGDSLNEQFANMTANPDIIIATPGRFLHLLVEMNLNVTGLAKMQYVVFDEADRLFEMGFAAQLQEILHSLPPTRQTLLFSATLPSSVTEFVRAGCQDPTLVRLDADTKVSPDLEAAVFSVKGDEKLGALLHILHDVIKIPTGLPEGVTDLSENSSKKRKRGPDASHEKQKPSPHATIVFTSTSHHVEFLQTMLTAAGFAVSYVYGSLDQTARKTQVDNFRRGRSNILVVTDVAARGIDIPLLSNAINYSFPATPKLYIHRVGRVARAGMRGWAFSLVKDTDVPYLLDLQLFLGQKLILGKEGKGTPSFTSDMVVGAPVRSKVENYTEWLNKVLADDSDLANLLRVSDKAEKLYLKTRNSASSQSARRAREVVASKGFSQVHPLYGDDASAIEDERAEMLAKIGGFKPQETIFEIGRGAKGGRSKEAEVMKSIRERFGSRRTATGGEDKETESNEASDEDADDAEDADEFGVEVGETEEASDDDEDDDEEIPEPIDSDSEMEVTISNHTDPGPGNKSRQSSKAAKKSSDFRDPEFMAYEPRTINAAETRGYGVHSGGQSNASGNFFEAARSATFDLTNDEGAKSFGAPTRAGLRWDKKSNKYVSRNNDEDGSRMQQPKSAGSTSGVKYVRGESGVKIASTFQSGRFERWKKEQRVGRLPRIGEAERRGPGSSGATTILGGGARYKHKQEKAPKAADKYRDDYHARKKRVAEAKEKRVGRFRDGDGNKKELRNADDIRKDRKQKELRRQKNARPSRK